MRSRLFTSAALAVLLLNIVGLGFSDTRPVKAKKSQANALVALLPASDGVIRLDARRFFSEALPQVLTSNQPLLGKVFGHLDEIQNRTGIDLRKFDAVAVGVTITRLNEKQVDVDPVVIARGDIKTDGLLSAAKLAANGSSREEKVGSRTIHIFSTRSVKDVVQKATGDKSSHPEAVQFMGHVMKGVSDEIAVTALDANTIVFGSVARVKTTVEAATRVSPDLNSLLAGKETAIAAFALRTPDGMSNLLPLDNDEIGVSIDSIRFLSGSVDVLPTGTSVKVTAQTLKLEQAKGLQDLLVSFQLLGKSFLGSSKRADQRLYAKLIENARIARTGNNVSLDLTVAQSDVDALVASIK